MCIVLSEGLPDDAKQTIQKRIKGAEVHSLNTYSPTAEDNVVLPLVDDDVSSALSFLNQGCNVFLLNSDPNIIFDLDLPGLKQLAQSKPNVWFFDEIPDAVEKLNSIIRIRKLLVKLPPAEMELSSGRNGHSK